MHDVGSKARGEETAAGAGRGEKTEGEKVPATAVWILGVCFFFFRLRLVDVLASHTQSVLKVSP